MTYTHIPDQVPSCAECGSPHTTDLFSFDCPACATYNEVPLCQTCAQPKPTWYLQCWHCKQTWATDHGPFQQAPAIPDPRQALAPDDPARHRPPVPPQGYPRPPDQQGRGTLALGAVLIGLTLAGFLIASPGFRDAVLTGLLLFAAGAVLIALAVLLIWLFRRGYIGIGFWF
ncbi:MAG: hypothetical protein OXG36_05255 [Caldilineaceae bacterium]|nr:hypothetical protein [Caldilineaceae bacterium]